MYYPLTDGVLVKQTINYMHDSVLSQRVYAEQKMPLTGRVGAGACAPNEDEDEDEDDGKWEIDNPQSYCWE